ncbi:hypothetical protein ACVWZL_008586 [Bradyrhizobium sp. GM2.4]
MSAFAGIFPFQLSHENLPANFQQRDHDLDRCLSTTTATRHAALMAPHSFIFLAIQLRIINARGPRLAR